MKKIALIGCGNWGKNIARSLPGHCRPNGLIISIAQASMMILRWREVSRGSTTRSELGERIDQRHPRINKKCQFAYSSGWYHRKNSDISLKYTIQNDVLLIPRSPRFRALQIMIQSLTIINDYISIIAFFNAFITYGMDELYF